MSRGGDRRHLVHVQAQAPNAGLGTLSAPAAQWRTVFSTKASISQLSGRELLAAQAINVEISHQIGVIYRPEWANPKLAASYRILFGSRVFNIHMVDNVDERNRDVLIQASEGLNDG